MFVPSAIRRNQLVVMIAQSLASTKVLDQIDLTQRVANILAHGSMTSKEIIEKHKSMYPDIRMPLSVEFDIVLHHFLANMIVTWESKDPEGILFSLSLEIKQMQAEIKLKNLKTTPGLFLDIAKALVNKTDPTDFTVNESIVHLMTNRQWHIDRIALKLRDDYRKEIAADMPGLMKNLANHGIVAVPEFNNDGTQWYVTPDFLNVLAELKKEKAATEHLSFDHLAFVRAKDDQRTAEGIEEYLVYILPSEEAWQLSRISNEIAEYFVISDENLNQVLEALTNANVLTRRLEVILSTPTWSLSSSFVNAVEAKRRERNRQEGVAKAIEKVNGGAMATDDAKKNYRTSLAKFMANGDLDGKLTPAFIVASHLVGVSVTYDMLGSLLENGKDTVDDIPAALKELQENGVVKVMLEDTNNPLMTFTKDFEKEMESYLKAGLPSGSFQASTEGKTEVAKDTNMTFSKEAIDGGLRRGELIVVGASTSANSSRQVHADAARTLRQEVRSYAPKTGMRHEDTIVTPFNTEFVKGDESDNKGNYTLLPANREGAVVLIDTEFKIDRPVLANYVNAGILVKEQSTRFNVALCIQFGYITPNQLCSVLIAELGFEEGKAHADLKGALSDLVQNDVLEGIDDSSGVFYQYTNGFKVLLLSESTKRRIEARYPQQLADAIDCVTDRSVGRSMHNPKAEVGEESIPTSELKGTRPYAERIHHEAFHELEKGVLGEKEIPLISVEFMGTKYDVQAAREVYDQALQVLSLVQDNSALNRMFPTNAFVNVEEFVQQFDKLFSK